MTVLDPFGVWSKYMNLSSNGTIPAGYSLTLILRVLLVEGMLLLMGLLRIRQTKKALSTPGARFEDLSRETDGTYLEILRKVSKIT